MSKFLRGLALTATLIGSAATVQAETVLKLASVAPSTSPWGKWVAGVAQQIEEKSGGDLKLQLLLDAQAGDEQTILRQTIRGRIDIAYVSNTPLTILSQEIALASAPYLFSSAEEGTCVAHEHMGEVFGTLMQDAGVVPLTWMEVGQYVIFSKDPVKVPTDLNGKKTRVAATVTDEAYARALGTSGVPMGTSDTIPALQTGTVDAAFFPTVFGIAIGTHKVAPHVVQTNHSRLIGTAAVSERSWAKLSPEHQALLKETFGAAGPQLTAMILGAEQALLGKLETAGVPVYRPTQDELAQWQAAAANVLEETANDIGGKSQEVVAALNAAKAVCAQN